MTALLDCRHCGFLHWFVVVNMTGRPDPRWFEACTHRYLPPSYACLQAAMVSSARIRKPMK